MHTSLHSNKAGVITVMEKHIPLCAMYNRDSNLDIATPRHCLPTLNAHKRARALIYELDPAQRWIERCFSIFFAFKRIHRGAINHFPRNDARTG